MQTLTHPAGKPVGFLRTKIYNARKLTESPRHRVLDKTERYEATGQLIVTAFKPPVLAAVAENDCTRSVILPGVLSENVENDIAACLLPVVTENRSRKLLPLGMGRNRTPRKAGT